VIFTLTGNLLVGSLKFQYVEMLTFTGTKLLVTKIATDVGRLRNMQGPDGYIYLGEGKGILK
jgi:quinoprotein glucose dehydrogenase